MSFVIADYIHQLTLFIDTWTGIKGSTGYILIFLVAWTTHRLFFSSPSPPVNMAETHQQKERDSDPPRNFTAKQLAYFDGSEDEKSRESKPVYLSVNGTVFDVSDGRNFYGPEGTYGILCLMEVKEIIVLVVGGGVEDYEKTIHINSFFPMVNSQDPTKPLLERNVAWLWPK
jgi:hypothetical protein